MRINRRIKLGQDGGALLVVMLIAGVLISATAAYLSLVEWENKAVMRSLYWNNALPIAEAGIDEAMSHIGSNTNGWAVDGWTANGAGYFRERPVNNDRYAVTIAGDLNTLVTITSTGTAHAGDIDVSRTVQVTARARNYPPALGLVAKGVTFGGSLYIDSYDTTDPLYRNPLKYAWYDPLLNSDSAFVGNPLTTFALGGNATILGYVASARGYAAPSVGGSATVGSKTWLSKGAESGHATNGFFVAFPDVRRPYANANTPISGTRNGTNYNYILTDNNYYAASLTAASSLYVTGYCRLYVTGAVDIATIQFENSAHLDLYIAAPSISFCPKVLNGTPPQFIVWGLPTCTSMDMTGGKQFVGVIYAPETDLKASGNSEFFGSLAVNTFKANGSFKMHHDLAAGKTNAPEALTILSWTEL